MAAIEEILIFVGFLFGVCLALILLARVIWWGVVRMAKRNGYTSDDMPMHYHMFGIGTYFSILFVLVGVFLLT